MWTIRPTIAARPGGVLRRQLPAVMEMHTLSRHTAAAIYKRVYWHAPAFDQLERLAPKLAAEMFDTGVNMGTGTAIGFLQRALNALNRNSREYTDIFLERKIGPETLRAVKAFLRCRGPSAEPVLTKAIDALQGARYVHLAESRPAQEAFLYGWLANRIG